MENQQIIIKSIIKYFLIKILYNKKAKEIQMLIKNNQIYVYFF